MKKVNVVINEDNVSSVNDTDTHLVTIPEIEHKYLVLAGKGHIYHGFGVPERLFTYYPELREQSEIIVCETLDLPPPTKNSKSSTTNQSISPSS